MDLAKFVWVLQNKALHFTRVDHLGDPYEGHYTRIQAEGVDAYVQRIREIRAEMNPNETIPVETEESLRQQYQQILRVLTRGSAEQYVSSWHINEQESAAMWRLYTSLNESICVSTTYEKLRDALPPEVHLGQVRYINYDREIINWGNVFNFVTHKRESYSYEREVRGVVWELEGGVKERGFAATSAGVIVPVDLALVIESVYLSPQAVPLLRSVVEGLLSTYAVTAAVLQSEANAPPPH
jgi:hypothetical protein